MLGSHKQSAFALTSHSSIMFLKEREWRPKDERLLRLFVMMLEAVWVGFLKFKPLQQQEGRPKLGSFELKRLEVFRV